jgi:hypothetical protein
MSDSSVNKYDGQPGCFGRWRDISADELAYETKVRTIVGVVGGAMGLLCIIFATLYANGKIDGGLGLGVSIPTGIAAGVMVPVGIFYNHGWHLRGYGTRGHTAPPLSPLEAEASKYIKEAGFHLLKNYFCGFPNYYWSEVSDQETVHTRPRRRNLEEFVNGGVLKKEQGNFVRAILGEHEEVSSEMHNLMRQKIVVPNDLPQLGTHSEAANEAIRLQNEKNAESRKYNEQFDAQIALKKEKLKEIEQRWTNERPLVFAGNLLVDGPKHRLEQPK